MATGMVDQAQLRDWLRLAQGADDALVTAISSATSAWVNSLPWVASYGAQADPWPEEVTLGATMLAARLYRRRNSPAGIDQITDAGIAYVARSDSDVASLLGLGAYMPPAIA